VVKKDEILASADELASRFEDGQLGPGRTADGASLRAVRLAAETLSQEVKTALAAGHSQAVIDAMIAMVMEE
jgi:hypothetical protein